MLTQSRCQSHRKKDHYRILGHAEGWDFGLGERVVRGIEISPDHRLKLLLQFVGDRRAWCLARVLTSHALASGEDVRWAVGGILGKALHFNRRALCPLLEVGLGPCRCHKSNPEPDECSHGYAPASTTSLDLVRSAEHHRCKTVAVCKHDAVQGEDIEAGSEAARGDRQCADIKSREDREQCNIGEGGRCNPAMTRSKEDDGERGVICEAIII